MDKPAARVSIVIPAFREEATIAQVVEGVRKACPEAEVIVVDDGSPDATGQRASEAGAKVVRHPYNIGNGAAIKTGARQASGDKIVFMDGDGQHDPQDIPKLLAELDQFDMVVGARTSESDVSRFRSFGNFWLTRVANYLAERKIDDLTSGFRGADRAKFCEFLHLLPNTYSYPTTCTLAFLKSGYTVKYVPLPTIKRREHGQSQVRPFRDGFRFIIIILRIIMLFDPLKIFLPASLVILLLAAGILGYNLVVFQKIKPSAVITVTIGVFVFFFGLLADQLAHIRREISFRR